MEELFRALLYFLTRLPVCSSWEQGRPVLGLDQCRKALESHREERDWGQQSLPPHSEGRGWFIQDHLNQCPDLGPGHAGLSFEVKPSSADSPFIRI